MATTRLERETELEGAVSRAASAGQHLLVDRLELAQLEARDALARASRVAALRLGGALLLLCGWGLLVSAAVLGLARLGLSLTACLAIAAVPHLLAGGVVLGLSRGGSEPT